VKWLITANLNSSQNVAHPRVQASNAVLASSPWSKLDPTASGLISVIHRRITTRFR